MPDKARDGRNVALKILSDCWHAQSSKEEFLLLSIFVLFSLAEQAEAQERQEQKVSGLTKELEAVMFDRDSLEKKYQEAGKEKERVMSELVQTRAE